MSKPKKNSTCCRTFHVLYLAYLVYLASHIPRAVCLPRAYTTLHDTRLHQFHTPEVVYLACCLSTVAIIHFFHSHFWKGHVPTCPFASSCNAFVPVVLFLNLSMFFFWLSFVFPIYDGVLSNSGFEYFGSLFRNLRIFMFSRFWEI